jgi:hypothetical protein
MWNKDKSDVVPWVLKLGVGFNVMLIPIRTQCVAMDPTTGVRQVSGRDMQGSRCTNDIFKCLSSTMTLKQHVIHEWVQHVGKGLW